MSNKHQRLTQFLVSLFFAGFLGLGVYLMTHRSVESDLHLFLITLVGVLAGFALGYFGRGARNGDESDDPR